MENRRRQSFLGPTLTESASRPGSLTGSRPFDPAGLGRALLLIHLVLSPLFFSTDFAEAFEYGKGALFVFISLLLGALGLSGWLGRMGAAPGQRLDLLKKQVRGLLRDPLAVGFLLFLASAVVSTFFSISPRTSYHGTWGSHGGTLTILSYTILFFATRSLCRNAEEGRRLLAGAVIGAAVASTYALLQVARLDPIEWDKVSLFGRFVRPFATLGHPNFLSAYLVMILPTVAYFLTRQSRNPNVEQVSRPVRTALKSRPTVSLLRFFARGAQDSSWKTRLRRRLPVWVFASLGVLIILVVVLTLSRGAWLALGCTLATLGIGWLVLGKGRQVAWSLAGVSGLAAVGLACVCLAAPGKEELRASMAERLQRLAYTESRQEIWQAALGLFRDHPLTGCGLDTFSLAFPQKRTVAFCLAEWNTTPLRAHNEALHILATQGLLGLSAATLLVFGLVRASVRAWRRASDIRSLEDFGCLHVDRPLLSALLAGLVGFFVQNLFNFTVAGYGTLFVTQAALLARFARPLAAAEPSCPTSRRGFILALIVADLLAAGSFFYNVSQSPVPEAAGYLFGYLAVVLAFGLTTLAVVLLEEHPRGPKFTGTSASPRAVQTPWLVRILQVSVWFGTAALVVVWVLLPARASMACRQGDRWMRQDPCRAMAEYEWALALDRGNDNYWAKLGTAAHLGGMGMSKGSAERRALLLRGCAAFEHARALVPINSFYHACLGRVMMELSREGLAAPVEAFAYYDRALNDDGNNAYYYVEAANAALVLEELARAKEYVRRGEALYPGFGLLRAHSGYIALVEKRPADAMRILSEALALDWRGEENSRRFALSMLAKAQKNLGGVKKQEY